MIKVHHNTLKKAKAHGITLVADDDIVASKDGVQLARGMQGNKVLDEAINKLGEPYGMKPGMPPRTKKTRGVVAGLVKAMKAKKPAKARDENEDEEIEDGEQELEDEMLEAEEGKSIVKRKYKTRYRPFKMTCGDDLAQLVAKHIKDQDDDEGGKPRINKAKLVRFAKANDCWVTDYSKLNIGMQRMNVVNRLRAKIRRDKHTVVWA